jgi:hypothetical protein
MTGPGGKKICVFSYPDLQHCLQVKVVLTSPLPTVLLQTFDDDARGLLPVVDDLLVERLPRRHAVPQVRHLVLLQVLLNQRPTTSGNKVSSGCKSTRQCSEYAQQHKNQCCGSGIRDPGSGAFLTPGSGMGRKSASGSGMNNQIIFFRA